MKSLSEEIGSNRLAGAQIFRQDDLAVFAHVADLEAVGAEQGLGRRAAAAASLVTPARFAVNGVFT